MMKTAIPAFYFDGKTSRRHQVELSVEAGVASICGEARRACPIAALRVSERMENAARAVTFPDGAYLEVQDNAAFEALLAATGHREPLAVRLQRNWRGALAAFAAAAAVLIAGYLYGLPAASEAIAKSLPESVDRMVGREALDFLDRRWFAPSELSRERRASLTGRFHALAPPRQGAPRFEIVFRKSRIGPNAFALPSGQIVLADEIVELLGDDDDALMGVLAHELGHLHERHIMRRIIQGSVIAAAATVLFGDLSAAIANIPTVLLDLKYSRDAEREADDYAANMLRANGIDPARLALAFEKLEKDGNSRLPYLSSHPPSAERSALMRK